MDKNEDNEWYSEKGRTIDEKNLMSLYLRYHEDMGESLNRHFNIRNYYTVLLSALLGLTMGGRIQLANSQLTLLAELLLRISFLMLSLLICGLSIIAIKSATRYYKGFLRMVVLVAKIENVLGLDDKIKLNSEKINKKYWKKDERFMIESYWKSRINPNIESSEDFIERMKHQGDNKYTILIFGSFLSLGIYFSILQGLLLQVAL